MYKVNKFEIREMDKLSVGEIKILDDQIRKDLAPLVSKKRYKHVLGVAEAAKQLAAKYGANENVAELTALLHDMAKEKSVPDMQTLAIRHYPTLPDEIREHGNLLHGFAAAAMAVENYGILDQDVLAAIAHHTVGNYPMSLLEKIIFLADYIEKNRDFPGVRQLREVAEQNLDKAVLLGFDMTVRYLLETGESIYIGTIIARNVLLEEMATHGAI
jgi:predicted HD superfamily hydrolase involved in NAD metabolism